LDDRYPPGSPLMQCKGISDKRNSQVWSTVLPDIRKPDNPPLCGMNRKTERSDSDLFQIDRERRCPALFSRARSCELPTFRENRDPTMTKGYGLPERLLFSSYRLLSCL
jgi:hypothetical protein